MIFKVEHEPIFYGDWGKLELIVNIHVFHHEPMVIIDEM